MTHLKQSQWHTTSHSGGGLVKLTVSRICLSYRLVDVEVGGAGEGGRGKDGDLESKNESDKGKYL